jgi:hypothetical protein
VVSLTIEIERVATAVGAGVLLGGFLAGSLSLLGLGRSRPKLVAEIGYVGGWFALVALVADRLTT